MPASFNKCVKGGGRVRTIKLSGNQYKKICFSGGKSYAGETHTKKDAPKKKESKKSNK